MGQPNPPGDNVPLFEGLGSEWNDIVSAFPEDRRSELAPLLKERISAYEPLKQWEYLQKSGITPEHASTALNIYSVIENNPRDVYEAIGKSLGITTAEAKEVVEEIQDGDSEDPRMAHLQQQVETMAQVLLAQRNQTMEEKRIAEQEMELDNELKSLSQKYGDVPEKHILMRMQHMDMSAEEAYKDYMSDAEQIRARRPAPFVMGAGGSIPSKQIDVRKLDNKSTKSLVAQMLDHANAEARN
jgi:hypothetical protein